jgi:hypothetical protein
MNHYDTEEARAKRRQRSALRKAQGIDVLAKREQLITQRKERAADNPAFGATSGAWWHCISWSRSFRHLLLPTARARQDAKDKAWAQACAERAHAYDIKCAAAKAQRLAATKPAEPVVGTNLELFA